MAKHPVSAIEMTRKSSRLAEDIRASLREAHNHASGKTTKAIVHRVTPKETEAREARLMLGLSQDEFAALIGTGVGTVRKWELGSRRPSDAARTLSASSRMSPKLFVARSRRQMRWRKQRYRFDHCLEQDEIGWAVTTDHLVPRTQAA